MTNESRMCLRQTENESRNNNSNPDPDPSSNTDQDNQTLSFTSFTTSFTHSSKTACSMSCHPSASFATILASNKIPLSDLVGNGKSFCPSICEVVLGPNGPCKGGEETLLIPKDEGEVDNENDEGRIGVGAANNRPFSSKPSPYSLAERDLEMDGMMCFASGKNILSFLLGVAGVNLSLDMMLELTPPAGPGEELRETDCLGPAGRNPCFEAAIAADEIASAIAVGPLTEESAEDSAAVGSWMGRT